MEMRVTMRRAEKKRQLRVLGGAMALWAEELSHAKYKRLSNTKAAKTWHKNLGAKAVTWWHQV